MKKSLILIILLLLPLISGVEFTIKEVYDQGETLISRVSGNFLEPVLEEDIFFYRGHVPVPMEYDIRRIEGDYYIYALLPENEAEYSILLKDIKFQKGSSIIEGDVQKNFTISNLTADFRIKPGFIIAEDDFSFELQNLKETELRVDYRDLSEVTEEGSPEKSFEAQGFFGFLMDDEEVEVTANYNSINLKSGEIKKVTFNYKNFELPTFKTIEFLTENTLYNVPTYLLPEEIVEKEKSFEFFYDVLNVTLSTNEAKTFTLTLENTGEKIIDEIIILMSSNLHNFITLSTNEIIYLDIGESTEIDLEIVSSEEDNTYGEITAISEIENIETSMEVYLEFIEDYVPLEPKDKTCLEIGGVLCDTKNNTCENGDSVFASDGICCTGECEEKTESNLTQRLIGIGLLVLIIAVLVWFYLRRYKNQKKAVDLVKISKGKKK